MRVLIKEPGKPWETAEVENTLEALQGVVGGYIETIPIVATDSVEEAVMVMVDGHIYWAQDTGVRGKHIDVYYDSHSVAWNHGVKRQHVFVWRRD